MDGAQGPATLISSSQEAASSRKERSDVAGRGPPKKSVIAMSLRRGDPEWVLKQTLDCHASLAMTDRLLDDHHGYP